MVATIASWPLSDSIAKLHTGQVFGLTLHQRGGVISHREDTPAISDVFSEIFWLGKSGAALGSEYKLKLGTAEVPVKLSIEQIVHTSNVEEDFGGVIQRNQAADVTSRTKQRVVLDDSNRIAATGRFALNKGTRSSAAGLHR
jgi:sulfate adenylyltransferase subunit 1 (EFTu-like GTPase family)